MKIKPFRLFWQDCYNCIVYSLIDYAMEFPKLFFYNNMYWYKYTPENVNCDNLQYTSFVPWTDNFKLMDEITTNVVKYRLFEDEDPLSIIKESVDQGKVVLLGVDLYYWINEGLHYLNNHITHTSLVTGYDDETQELIVMDTGLDMFAEFRVDYERAVKSVHSSTIITRIGDLNKDACIRMFEKKDIADFARVVMESIDDLIAKKDEIWKVQEASDEGLNEVFVILQTHMFSMQNRQEINGYLFENGFVNDVADGICLHEEFYKMARAFENLKGVCIKAQLRSNKLNELEKVKTKVYNMLDMEKKLWQLYIDSYENLEMKSQFSDGMNG